MTMKDQAAVLAANVDGDWPVQDPEGWGYRRGLKGVSRPNPYLPGSPSAGRYEDGYQRGTLERARQVTAQTADRVERVNGEWVRQTADDPANFIRIPDPETEREQAFLDGYQAAQTESRAARPPDASNEVREAWYAGHREGTRHLQQGRNEGRPRTPDGLPADGNWYRNMRTGEIKRAVPA